MYHIRLEKKKLNLLEEPIIINSVGLIFFIGIFFYYINNFSLTRIFLFVVLILFFFILINLPTYLMLKSYKRNNIFNKVEIELNKEISLHTFLDIKVYNYDNIEFVYFVSDFNYAFPWLSQFNYLTIYFDDGKSAIITSLMHRELLEVLKYFDGIPMKVINRSPCYINLQLDKGAKNIALLRPEITTLISKSKFI